MDRRDPRSFPGEIPPQEIPQHKISGSDLLFPAGSGCDPRVARGRVECSAVWGTAFAARVAGDMSAPKAALTALPRIAAHLAQPNGDRRKGSSFTCEAR